MKKTMLKLGIYSTLFLMISSAIAVPQVKIKMQSTFNNLDFKYNNNSFYPDEEGDHFPCANEWWWIYATLILDNGEQWDVALMIHCWMNRTIDNYKPGSSAYRVQCWDRESGDKYDFVYTDDEYPNNNFYHKKNTLNLQYHNCSMIGLYPDYIIHGEDNKNNISFTLDYHAVSIPYWAAQESTDSYVPFGFSGINRYGCIPRSNVTGNISINGSYYNVTGVGYYEHLFGDMDLTNPLKIHSVREFLDISKIYSNMLRWWKNEFKNNIQIPKDSIHLGTDSKLGWDWFWLTFDNGYTIILHRIVLLGVVEGRTLAILMLTDGKTCWEFGSVYYYVKRAAYMETLDLYIPLDFEIIAYKGNKKVHIVFNSTTEMTELYEPENKLGCYNVAGVANGYFVDGEENITLNGIGTNTPARFDPKVKYRSLKIESMSSDEEKSITIKRISHRFGFELFLKIQLKPKFEFSFYYKPASYTEKP